MRSTTSDTWTRLATSIAVSVSPPPCCPTVEAEGVSYAEVACTVPGKGSTHSGVLGGVDDSVGVEGGGFAGAARGGDQLFNQYSFGMPAF